jgi:hypothetical protein
MLGLEARDLAQGFIDAPLPAVATLAEMCDHLAARRREHEAARR